MFINKLHIPILIKSEEIFLEIYGESSDSVLEITEAEAESNGESRFQLKEGCFYEYKISNKNYRLRSEIKDIVKQSNIDPSSGRISPNIYVGTLILEIYQDISSEKYQVRLEVYSVKTEYREDYRVMLGEITERCTDLLMQHTSPVVQNFEPDFERDPKTLYQRFAFLKSILDSEEFNDSVLKIISSPITKWKEIEIDNDIRSVRRLNNKSMKQIVGSSNRIDLPFDHQLKNVIQSVPSRLKVSEKSETVDTPENRFIKYVLNSFLTFCGILRTKLSDNSRNKLDAARSEKILEQYLNYSIFKEISSPDTLPLNSPVLQRKEGYRDILKIWLMFNLAAKLIWAGGENVYEAGKRDVAVLYEYWLFFKLMDIIKEVFNIEPKSTEDLIKKTADGLGLMLKQGNHIAIKGIYNGSSRKFNIEFSYNRTFSGEVDYPNGGSWTKNMRPDYTLTIWPYDIPYQIDAEKEEIIVHIHFDAKYKIENLYNTFGNDINLDEEKTDQSKGNYKRSDLLKMHSYRDAIRRTGGAYILYPGNQTFKKRGFHEIIPGLGAFPIRPSKTDTGEDELKTFIKEVVDHFMNRASQREKSAFRTFDIYKDNSAGEVKELLPEAFGPNRDLIPDDTFILIAYYKDQDHFNWIDAHHLYNARTGSERGSLHLSFKETGARYLLLHSKNETITGHLYKLKHNGPRIFSKDELIEILYPNPTHNFYLVFETENEPEKEFIGMSWDITKLKKYSKYRGSSLPFSVSLTELMKVLI